MSDETISEIKDEIKELNALMRMLIATLIATHCKDVDSCVMKIDELTEIL